MVFIFPFSLYNRKMELVFVKTVKEAFKASIPVMMGYIVLGIAFGILLESKGYGVIYAFLMSMFIYAGSMQFVGIDLLFF